MIKAEKILIIIVLLLGIFFRFANLDQKVYSADEVRKILRLSGYTSQGFIERVFTGDTVSVEEIQRYQRPTPEKNLSDTIKALTGNPEHPPLYFLITRFWMQLFNATISARVSSVLISFIALPCLYWLCLELFQSSLVGWVAISLVAISPLHILTAQNASQYSLWTVAVFLSSAALLKALRVATIRSWIIYTLTLAMGLYTHGFFTLVAFGQGLYVFIIEQLRLTHNLLTYLLSSVGGLLIFSPWILVVLSNLDKLEKNTTYYSKANTNIPKILEKFRYNLSNIFLDFQDTTRLEKYLDFLLFILIAYSIYFLCRNTSIKAWFLVLVLIVLTPIINIIADLISPSARSLQSRYYLPCFLGIQLAVAYTLATPLTSLSLKLWQRRLWQIIFLSLILVGVISGVFISQSRDLALDDQKGTASSLNLQLAPIINKAEQPLVISEATHSFILALSYLVDDKVKFQLVKSNDVADWNKKINLSAVYNQFSDVFVYVPDQQFLNFLNQDKKFQTELVPTSPDGKHKILYKIIPK